MASDCYQKTRLFPSQLLLSEDTPANINSSTMIGVSNKSWLSETNSKASGSSSGSSWSDLSSELGSTETGSADGDKCDDDFIAQLSRQMADYMLEEEEEEEEEEDGKGGRTSSCGANNLEVYKVEDQPSPKDTNYSSPGGRPAKWTELTQPLNPEIHTPAVHYQRHVQQNKNNNKGKAWPSHEQQSRQKQKQQRFPVSGAGMKAVFLAENGTKSVSSGTGVFLPRGTGSLTEVTRKKRGCSTVLIPARVLQTLQVHFQDMNKRAQAKTSLQSDSISNKSHQLQDDVVIIQSSELDGYKELHLHPNTASDDATSDNQDMDLPPEWIY